MTAAAKIDLHDVDSRRYAATVINQSRNQARTAWGWYDKIATIHKAVSRSARIAGYARLRVVKVNPDGSDGDTIEDTIVEDIISGIYSPYGGTRGLIDRFYSLMKIPGDSYLIRIRDDDGPDGYHFLSSDEIDKESTDVGVLSGTKAGPLKWRTLPTAIYGNTDVIEREVAPDDVLGRVWLPGRRYVDLPDSPLYALRTECDILHTLTLSLKGRLRSRFALAGMLFIPSEISDVVIGGAQGSRMDVLDYLTKAFSRNMQQYEEASVALPVLMRGPGESGEKIRWITIDRELLEQDLALRKEMNDEILFGLDIQAQATKGTESDQSRFVSWTNSDEEVRIAVQPDLDIMCWALTRLIVHPMMKELGYLDGNDAEILKHRMAWDMSESAARTNKQEDTRQAYDRGLAGGRVVLKTTGLSVTDDAMTDAEFINFVGRKNNNPYLELFGRPGTEDIDWEQVKAYSGKTGPGADSEGADPNAGPGVGDPGSPNDSKKPTKRSPS